MSPLKRTIFFLALFLTANVSAFAYPNFLEDYKADKFTNPKNKDVICNFCHMSPGGVDERNEFGKTFEAGGEKFTTLLRAQFPERPAADPGRGRGVAVPRPAIRLRPQHRGLQPLP